MYPVVSADPNDLIARTADLIGFDPDAVPQHLTDEFAWTLSLCHPSSDNRANVFALFNAACAVTEHLAEASPEAAELNVKLVKAFDHRIRDFFRQGLG